MFPVQLGTMVRGILTAHSHPDVKKVFVSEMNYVWPYINGMVLSLMIEPFYPKQVEASYKDEVFYKLLALVDIIRAGKVREIDYAVKDLKPF